MVAALCLALCLCGAGCEEDPLNAGRLELVWGRRGISAGRLQKPRCMALDAQDRLYVVDMTARIQVFTADGEYLHGWQTPEHVLGRPSGITVTANGEVLVADTHYNRVLIYTSEGKLLRILGGGHVGRPSGGRPGELGLVTCALRDAEGNYYISEYGEYDRVQKFSPQGEFLLEWGGHGTRPGQFSRPQKMAWDEQQRIWIVDACNHRIQVFDAQGNYVTGWGTSCDLYAPDRPGCVDPDGGGPQQLGDGQFREPWGVAVDANGIVYVADTWNHRIQKFTLDG